MTRLFPTLIVLLCIAACSKDGSSNSNLTGKWKQIEYYKDSSMSGGCNCWKTVNEIQSEKIEFKSDGTYQRTPPLFSSVAYCLGDYRVVNDSTLTWNMSCTTIPVEETHWFSKEGNILIIGYKGPSYNFKSKYKKVNKY